MFDLSNTVPTSGGHVRTTPTDTRPTATRGARRLLALGVACLLVVAAACGSDDDGGGGATTPSSPATTAVPGTTAVGDGPGTPAPQPLAQRTSVVAVPGIAIEVYAALFLAEQMGEFDKENLDMTIQILPPTDALLALEQGDAQLQPGGVAANTLNANAGGADFRYIAGTHQTPATSKEGLWVRNEFLTPEGGPAESLRGGKIATGTIGAAASSVLPVQRWLDDFGWSVDDVEIASLNSADLLSALENGAIAGGYLLAPAWQMADQGDYAQLVSGQPPLSAGVYVMTEDLIRSEPDVAAAIARAMLRTVRTYLQGDYHADAEVMDALAEALGSPVEALTAGPSLVFDPDMGIDTDMIEELQEVWIEIGDVLSYDTPLPPADVVDTSPVDAALGR
jgi:NitT/TauT family transport system substrate-binding protein